MKIRIILSTILLSLLISTNADAQVLKRFGKMIEKKVVERVDRKAERSVDKVLDKADQKSDQPIDNALNPSSKTETKKQINTVPIPTTVDGGLVKMAESCSDFIWFKQGSFVEFETLAANGKRLQKSKMTVKSIRKDGGVMVAAIQASDDKGNSFEMQYKCIGDRLYMDFGAMMREAMKKAGQSKTDTEELKNALSKTKIDMTEGFMSFPKNMYVGQELDPVSISIKTSPSPQMSMEITSTQQNRKVTAKEKITVPAGTFECLKLTAEFTANMKMMGMNKKMPSSTEESWFAPRIGVVKQLNYSEKGKLESTTQLISYKF